MKAIPSTPAARVKFFTTQINLLKAKRAPAPLIAACRQKLNEAKQKLSQLSANIA